MDVYGPGAVVPGAVTEKAGKPSRTTVPLNGTVNGEGKSGHYFFQYGTSEALDSSTLPIAFSEAPSPRAVSLKGWLPGAPTSSGWSPKTKTVPATGSPANSLPRRPSKRSRPAPSRTWLRNPSR